MALRAISAFTPDPTSASRPLKNTAFTFSVRLVDTKASTPTARALELRLAEANSFVFANGSKAVARNRTVGAVEVDVTFDETISGDGADTASFRVTLSEAPSNVLAACFVMLE